MMRHALRGGERAGARASLRGEHAVCGSSLSRLHTWSRLYSERSDSRLSKPFFEGRFLRTGDSFSVYSSASSCLSAKECSAELVPQLWPYSALLLVDDVLRLGIAPSELMRRTEEPTKFEA